MGIASWDFKLPESVIEETVGEIRNVLFVKFFGQRRIL